MKSWLQSASVYRDRRILSLLFLGFSSGLPFGVLADPLTAWLADSQVSKTAIGLFALVSIPYSLKFLWAPLIVVATVSRAPMVAMMAALPNARAGGLSQSVGRPSGATAALAGLIALAVAVVFLPWSAFAVLLVVALAGIACAVIAMAKINGQTGDILGATQQICEIAALTVLAAHLG